MCFIRNLLLQTDFLVFLNFHMWFFPTVVLTTKPRVLYDNQAQGLVHSKNTLCHWALLAPALHMSFHIILILQNLFLLFVGSHCEPQRRTEPAARTTGPGRGGGAFTAHKSDLPSCSPSALSWLGVFFTGFAMSLFLNFAPFSNCHAFGVAVRF